MKRWMLALLVLPLLASAKDEKARVKEDIAAHRAIAAAHEKAAKCLEGGGTEKQCHAHFAAECKGLALGTHCGMRHRH